MNDELMHYGIKGMKWGVRRFDIPGVSRKTSKEAYKDATEFARAKMYYGEGAGVRRRLIKASVESKSKSPEYKKAFDHHMSNMDMDKAASKARSQRKSKNAKNAVARGGKHASGVVNLAMGNPVATTAVATTLFAAGSAAHKAGVDKVVMREGSKLVNAAVREAKAQKIKRAFNAGQFFK